jgi:predicted RNA binding protein YcfA (HicA-like mRNA interferase family)
LCVVVCIISPVTSKEIIKRLISEGWFLAGGKGDHEKFKHLSKSGHVVVPHPRKDIAIGTLRSNYRQAGWLWKE